MEQMMGSTQVTFDEVLTLARRLAPDDQARLVVKLTPAIEYLLRRSNLSEKQPSRQSLYGILAHLGPAPSAEDIDEVQKEMWSFLDDEDNELI